MKCHSCFKPYKKSELKFYSNNIYCTECLKGILKSQGKIIENENISNVSNWKFVWGYISLFIAFLSLFLFPWYIWISIVICIIIYNIIYFYRRKKAYEKIRFTDR